jgi:hypothetical protein
MSFKRPPGTGSLHEKHGAYYGRWRTFDGRLLNRKIGLIRCPGESYGLTRSQAERAFRKLVEEEEARPRVSPDRVVTVSEAADSLRRTTGRRLVYGRPRSCFSREGATGPHRRRSAACRPKR